MPPRSRPGQVVIVTGASAGIGRATALAFARVGCRVVLAARRADLLDQLVEQISAKGGVALAVPTDMADPEQAAALVRQTLAAFGRIDIIVNNAAVGVAGLVDEVGVADFERLMRVNYLGPVALIRAALPALRAQRSGQIINVSSIVGTRAMPLSAAYCASKYALDGFSEALRPEVADDGILVSVIAPGLTVTDFGAVAEAGTRYAGRRRSTTGLTGRLRALRRRFAQRPEHVAEVIVRNASRPRRHVALTFGGRALLAADLIAPWLVDRLLTVYCRGAVRSLPRGG